MNILLILEGYEEETFFEIAKENGFASNLNVIFGNACGSGNVAPYFQSEISNEYYDCILCVYDVDNKINDSESPYNCIRSSLKKILLDDDKIDDISICTNPNILQFFLLAADKLQNVKIMSTSKTTNTNVINKYWPEIGKNKKLYDASEWQRKLLKDKIVYGPYSFDTLLKNAEELDFDYKQKNPASNLLPLLKALKCGDENYFQKAILVKEVEE